MMRVIERAAYRSMPWKNGLGSTTEIAIHPAGATVDDFCWRVSTAPVNATGPFSRFPGVNRTLIVLEGAGIDLAFAEGKAARLTRGSAPFAFAADILAEARLVDGPILDLNVMTRRRDFTHSVRELSGPAEWRASGTIVIFARGTALRVDDGVQPMRVAAGDTVVLEGARQSVQIIPENPGAYYLAQFTETRSPG